ncbi:S-adenosyl-L-methionine-dependent methyltransferase [Polychytrium aggregatum]|uniref:S-adenosyl-L-methionine-dependent methyltransferase n=1 Tax=Polychytrium aggregatum TaxID=110093 RepID=UPI0022FE9552|nr:S-adenosyl-L-methionine-dependent methyltransferase [Polychytrium aggregatum]KAI9208369.1 S-adenosyl-L-methionine-dependent methyltransferase [Polychytrium aggregatum]
MRPSKPMIALRSSSARSAWGPAGLRFPWPSCRLPATSIPQRTLHMSPPLRGNYWDMMHVRSQQEKRRKMDKMLTDSAGQTELPAAADAVDPSTFTRLTSADTAKRTTPPQCAKMLVREFINDALYHPKYGYFSKKAYIFSPPEDIPFTRLKDNYQVMNHLANLYKDIEGEYSDVNDIARQVWHTPTELFRPWYGYAVAQHILTQYKAERSDSEWDSKPLIIYEVGAGNGTLMMNILDYVQQNEPEIYSRMQYNIIEISAKLAEGQTRRKNSRGRGGSHGTHRDHINVVNKSILEWNEMVTDDCFVVAMEVIDNFAHDMVRYDNQSGAAVQGLVLIDQDGDYQEVYEHINDPLIQRYLEIRQRTGYKTPALQASWRRQLRLALPFAPNLSQPEFIPTMLMVMFERLHEYFPNHHVVLSDFSQLPDAIPGIDGPVVQTRYQGLMIPCSTYLVQPGWFDIFFPTNFELARDMYEAVCGSRTANGRARAAQVLTQERFLQINGNLKETTTRSGENPMLTFYKNMKFLVS